ncbi:TPA: hypothetical protein ACHV9Z_005239 [Klebsiella pneumoniae]
MTKSTINRERLEQLADNNTICKVSWDERIELAQIALSVMAGEPVFALKLPPKLSNDRESAHELNAGVDTWNRCIDEVAKINGEMITAGRVDGLHPSTMALVNDFATELAEKLHKAELKYGYSDAWANNGWMTECLADFHRHIAKGDPRDVAAYCAFMWYHGWKTEAAQPAPVVPEEATPDSIEILTSARRRDHAVFQWDEDQRNAAADSWNACRAAMLQAGTLIGEGTKQAGNSPAIPDGYVMVPKEPTKEMINARWLYYMGTKNPSSKGTYKAMLAAAPQEDINALIPLVSRDEQEGK